MDGRTDGRSGRQDSGDNCSGSKDSDRDRGSDRDSDSDSDRAHCAAQSGNWDLNWDWDSNWDWDWDMNKMSEYSPVCPDEPVKLCEHEHDAQTLADWWMSLTHRAPKTVSVCVCVWVYLTAPKRGEQSRCHGNPTNGSRSHTQPEPLLTTTTTTTTATEGRQWRSTLMSGSQKLTNI